MHGEVGPTVEHGGLNLLDEHALATHRVDRHVGVAVADGRDDDLVDLTLELRRHVTRLPQRQRTPRVAARNCIPTSAGSVEVEQIAQRVGEAIAPSVTGGVLEPDGGLVQQLVDDAPSHRLDGLALGRIEIRELAVEPGEFDVGDVVPRVRSWAMSGATSRAEVTVR